MENLIKEGDDKNIKDKEDEKRIQALNSSNTKNPRKESFNNNDCSDSYSKFDL